MMWQTIKKWIKWQPTRDNNYYFGLFLLHIGILSIFWYLIFDTFEPLAFLITFLICGWGFILLWKSDNDLRFKESQTRIEQLERELFYIKLQVTPTHLLKRDRR
ncbi:MAG: hypothetical protein GXY86_00120 [Firmicutes bacterium]|nr:hypothetical protein [Bacillota bacterium]